MLPERTLKEIRCFRWIF